MYCTDQNQSVIKVRHRNHVLYFGLQILELAKINSVAIKKFSELLDEKFYFSI